MALLALALEEIDEPNAQEILAERIGVHQGVISKWATGRSAPRLGSWDPIARAIGHGLTAEDVGAAIATDREHRPRLDTPLRRVERALEDRVAELADCRRELRAARRQIAKLQSGS